MGSPERHPSLGTMKKTLKSSTHLLSNHKLHGVLHESDDPDLILGQVGVLKFIQEHDNGAVIDIRHGPGQIHRDFFREIHLIFRDPFQQVQRPLESRDEELNMSQSTLPLPNIKMGGLINNGLCFEDGRRVNSRQIGNG